MTQIGFVMASKLMSEVKSMQNIIVNMVRFSIISLIIGITLAVILRKIKIALIGYEPSHIARLLIEREEIFDSLEEGLIAINREGEIITCK